MAELVAKRYASALFEAGQDLEKTNLFYEELKSLEVIFKQEEKLFQVLDHPKINNREKKELIDNIFKGKISQEVLNFLYILIDKKREQSLLEIIAIYEDLYYKEEGIVKVVAVTAIPLDEGASERLSKVLGEKLDKKIQLSNRVEEEIIGGVKLELEGKLIDGTIRGKLDSMARSFRAATN